MVPVLLWVFGLFDFGFVMLGFVLLAGNFAMFGVVLMLFCLIVLFCCCLVCLFSGFAV